MKRLLLFMMLVCAIGAMAQTQKTRDQLIATINTFLPDNNSKQITPAMLRGLFKDMCVSNFNLIDDPAVVETDPTISALVKSIDANDTLWWGRAEIDPTVSSWAKIGAKKITSGDTIITLEQYRLLANTANKSIYSITLPYSTTVAGRIALAVQGVDYPTGWTLEADGINLVVTHNLNRWCTDVKVFAKTTGTQRQQLRLTASDNGLTALNANQAEVFSLATISKAIVVYLNFE